MCFTPQELGVATLAIKAGDTEVLAELLANTSGLATAYIGSPREKRTLLHIATDWPGHLPNVASTIRTLVDAGADVNAAYVCAAHKETPLHFAASSDDVAALEALLDAGADMEAMGGVIAGGTPLTDAVAFGQWRAARVLVERGAKPTLNSAAALGLLDQVKEAIGDGDAAGRIVSQNQLDHAFWYACHGGQLEAAQLLYQRGADINVRPPWCQEKTVLDIANDYTTHTDRVSDENETSDATAESELATWLRSIGLTSMKQ